VLIEAAGDNQPIIACWILKERFLSKDYKQDIDKFIG
jgi:hypothetical protein